jgi:hypothetical protein
MVMAMEEIERVAAILKPSEIMLEWINEQVDEDELLSLEEAQMDSTIILLPTFDNEDEAESYLNEVFDDIFMNELSVWNEDESSWPLERSLEVFLEWFDIEFHSMVYDCAEKITSRQFSETLQ